MSAGARALALGLLLAGAAQAANDAAFVSQSVPIAMAPSQVYAVSVTFHNTGTTTWTPGSFHRLGTQNPQDNTLWTGSTRVMLPAGTSVAPGASYTFSFNVTAPSTPGTYHFQWKMLQESVEWFGAQSTSVPVTVGGLDTSVHFIHTDHLNTPRLVSNSTGTAVWRWDQQEPFGVNPADENTSGLGSFEFNLRFPGQYADKETNLFYNYFRDYDAALGRYIQSDPIGLEGGVNTYSYVESNPTDFSDEDGLQRRSTGNPRQSFIIPGSGGNQQGVWFRGSFTTALLRLNRHRLDLCPIARYRRLDRQIRTSIHAVES